MTVETILLATDLSPRCDRALDRAVRLATEWQAKLAVLHALQQNMPVSSLPSWRQAADPVQSARRQLSADVSRAYSGHLEIMVEHGAPENLILEATEKLRAGLVITGMARDELLGRVQLGSTVNVLARKSQVPVLVVKSRPYVPYRNIVVASDFSEGSRAALEAALEMFPDIRITLFHAFDVPFENLIDDRMTARRHLQQQAATDARAFLAATTAARARSIDVLCEYGDPGALLNDLIDARGVDLVVLGTEGRSGLSGILLGSVAQHLQASLPVDVLLVRRPRF